MSSVEDIANGLPHINFEAEADSELAQAVSDFKDYTEYLPSDMIRSLTLIRNLDERYRNVTLQVHNLTTQLGKLPSLPTNGRTDAQQLRAQIAAALQQAVAYREASFAEANRLAQSVDRNSARLSFIRKKLQALPLPPSRDPTPQPISPQKTRAQRDDVEKAPKITLHVSEGRKVLKHRRILVPGEVLPPPSVDGDAFTNSEPSSADEANDMADPYARARSGRKSGGIKVPKAPKTSRSRVPKPLKIRPPGQMGTNVHSSVAGISTSNALALLTPPPADAKPGSKWKPWFRLTEYEMAFLRKSMKKNAIWCPSETMIRRVLTAEGRGPEHYEKAKAAAEANGEEFLDEEPTDPGKTELGPGEIAHVLPSNQALSLENRGMQLNVAKKEKARRAQEQQEKEAAEAAAAAVSVKTAEMLDAPEAVDLAESAKTASIDAASPDQLDPPTPTQGKEKTIKATGMNEGALEIANLQLDEIGEDFKDLFSSTPPLKVNPPGMSKKESRSSKKRKRAAEQDSAATSTDTAITSVNDVGSQSAPKKLKLKHQALAPKPSASGPDEFPVMTTTVTTTTTVPLAPPASSPTRPSTRKQPTPGPISPRSSTWIYATAAQSRPRRTSGGVRSTTETADLAPSSEQELKIESNERELRPRSQGSMTGKAASAEPTANPRELREKRRASVVEAHPTSEPMNANGAAGQSRATRRSRRPAPGLVTDEADGKGKVSVGKRKAAPKKAGAPRGNDVMDQETADDAVDPNEPRYCICGDVSWGTMVACENMECEREWFHLDCVNLKEPPTRRQMWYCPECREKLQMSEWGDPLLAELPPRRR